MIEIDGSAGEGGGQILRTSLALAMCTGQPFLLTAIRAGRPKPGLMRQHLTCVMAAAEICAAEVDGAALGAQTLRFAPGSVRAGHYTFNIGTAGSCTLVLQTVWPALLLADAPSRLKLGGGTHNPMAPPFHFLARSYAPLLRRLGAHAELSLNRLGFYPAGGGEIEATIQPAREQLQPFDLNERGALLEAYAECLAPALPRAVARRELETLGSALAFDAGQLREGISRSNEGPGNALLVTLAYEHVQAVFTSIGEKGVGAERVAQRLAREVRAYREGGVASVGKSDTPSGAQPNAALDPQLADQWALPLALAVWLRGGAATYTCTALTPHALTNFDVIARFLPVYFETRGAGSHWMVRVQRR